MENKSLKETTLNSIVILKTTVELERTFRDLQILKEMGIANYKSLILHNDELLPAGAYNDYESFKMCYYAFSDIVKSDDIDSLVNASMVLSESMISMGEDERFQAFFWWKDYLTKRMESTNNEKYQKHKKL